MRIVATILLFISLTGNCQKRLGFSTSTNLRVIGKTVHVYGNSISVGFGASVNWPTLFCSARGAIKDNQSISGQALINPCGVAVFDKTTIADYVSGDVLILDLGINDIGNNKDGSAGTTASQFETKLIDVISYAITTKHWPPARIVVIVPHKPIDYDAYLTGCGGLNTVAADFTRAAAFNTKFYSVQSTYHYKIIDMYDYFDSIDTSTFFTSDHLHLIDPGQITYANYIIENL